MVLVSRRCISVILVPEFFVEPGISGSTAQSDSYFMLPETGVKVTDQLQKSITVTIFRLIAA
ncbi:hypothetical protein FR830_18385 [Klebsiella aerogenes]|nr:hypothetical protein F0333_06195 [Klebsiella aerogenes]MBE0175305.1 hypothetical protein [Klebsiella aerogenes]MBE0181023.1 hypothetical protein [Klebsiella aerogenes]MBE0246357.1 hypothetical protein [Klebsiella aerogenes]MBF8483716.1 hypothetical protein [Klebsiella aerogenes]